MEINKKIYEDIDKMYNILDENGKQKNKKFFSHLIKSYLPVSKVVIAFDRPVDKKTKVKCVFTKENLLTVADVMDMMDGDDFKNSVLDYMSSFDKDKGMFTSPTPMSEITKGKSIALTANGTETFMTQESYAAFLSWVSTKYITGDAHIKWLMNEITGNPFSKNAPKGPLDKKPKMNKTYSTDNKKTTLGDLSALQNLKNKFKGE